MGNTSKDEAATVAVERPDMPSEMEQAREALAPFARLVENYANDGPSDWVGAKGAVYVHDIRQAAKALAALASLPDRTGEPVAYASAEQIVALPADPADEGGAQYLPLRRTPAGKFQMALYASPDAEQARLRERVENLERTIRLVAEADMSSLPGYVKALVKGGVITAEARLAQQAERATAVTEEDDPVDHRPRPLASGGFG